MGESEREGILARMKIKVTARELLDSGLWDKYCDESGMNEYAINEGLMDDLDEVEISLELAQLIEKQDKKLSLIDKLKKIASIEPELCTERKVSAFAISLGNGALGTDKNGILNQDTQWMLIGRIVDDLQSLFPNTDIYINPPNGSTFSSAFLQISGQTAIEAPTLLEAVCDAWLSLRGGE